MNETPMVITPPPAVLGSIPQWLTPRSFEDVERLATKMAVAEWVPIGYRDKRTGEVNRNKVELAIMHGQTIGIPAIMAPQVIAVIGNVPTVWGDGMLALVMSSGQLEDIKEYYEGDGEGLTACCIVKRKGIPSPAEGKFSVAMAKYAKLWGKEGPWSTMPSRMLKMRARGFALRDRFADVLKGLRLAEEVLDEIIDITPAREHVPETRPERADYRTDVIEQPAEKPRRTRTPKRDDPPPADAAPVPPPPPPKPAPEPARAEPEFEDAAFELVTYEGEALEWSDIEDFSAAYREHLTAAFNAGGIAAGEGFYETNRQTFLSWAKNNTAHGAELEEFYHNLRRNSPPPDEPSGQRSIF